MSLRDATQHGEKTVVEHGLCFGSALAILAVAAFALQWLIAAIADQATSWAAEPKRARPHRQV